MTAAKAVEPDAVERVLAPMVVVETKDHRVRELYSGDIVTEDVSEKSLKHLRSIGFVG